jgi:hypothetical protein
MDINVLEPANALIKKYVEAIYIFEKCSAPLHYIAYPSTYTAIALFRNARVDCNGLGVTIKNTTEDCYVAMASNRLNEATSIHYSEMADEIAINFKPLGFALFTGHAPQKNNFPFHSWDDEIKVLFDNVFSASGHLQKQHFIEQFLLAT